MCVSLPIAVAVGPVHLRKQVLEVFLNRGC